MPSIESSEETGPAMAQWLPVPQQPIASIEHIGIVKNLEKATASLGGEESLQKFLTSKDPTRYLGLRLRPEDPFRRPIASGSLLTSNVLVKVTVLRRTGRKRKRGSNDPFTAPDDARPAASSITDAEVMMQSMRDNAEECQVEPVGLIDDTHRFRDLPDFQWSLMTSRTAKHFQETFLPMDWGTLKRFHIDLDTKGNRADIDMIPPPLLAKERHPHQYQYTQNTYVRTTQGANGQTTIVNRTSVPKRRMIMLKYGAKEIPPSQLHDLPDRSTMDDHARNLVMTIANLFEQRPIMTRRVLMNQLPHEVMYEVPYALEYCVYQFTSGPWKDSLIRKGLDPRKDSECGKYQTISLRGKNKKGRTTTSEGLGQWKWNRNATELPPPRNNRGSHIFDGSTVDADTGTWQVCDITDPFLAWIHDVRPRETCDVRSDGWFPNGAWAKVRVIMREKLRHLKEGRKPDDDDYRAVLKIPNDINEETKQQALLGRGTPLELDMAAAIRAMARADAKSSRGRGPHAEDSEDEESGEDDAGALSDEGDEQEDGERGDGVDGSAEAESMVLGTPRDDGDGGGGNAA